MKKIFIIQYSLFILVTLCVTACRPSGPSSYRGLPKEYTTAYEEIYGHFYDSVPYAVVALDLYSEGLSLNAQRKIQGTGYNLYISDIFVPDSLLAEGDYKSLISNSLNSNSFIPQPYTFLPGRDFEGQPHGMYLLNIEDDKIIQIQRLDSGRFSYRNDSLAFTLYYRNAYGERATYRTLFCGPLIPVKK